MTNPPNIDAIIAELSEATGPSRELDARIAVAYGILFVGPEAFPGGGYVYYRKDADGSESWPGQSGDQFVRPYTGSLDAAMTLVPEGRSWAVTDPANADGRRSVFGYPSRAHASIEGGGEQFYYAATPALALCMAALRVRSALIGEVGRDG